MYNEQSSRVPGSRQGETAHEARLRADRMQVRMLTKNLRDWVMASQSLPNREQVLQAVQDILDFVPPFSRADEAEEEHERKISIDL